MIRHIYVKKIGDTKITFTNTGYLPGQHQVRLFVKKHPFDETPFQDWTEYLTMNNDGSIDLDVPNIAPGAQYVYDMELVLDGKKNYPYHGVVWTHQ